MLAPPRHSRGLPPILVTRTTCGNHNVCVGLTPEDAWLVFHG